MDQAILRSKSREIREIIIDILSYSRRGHIASAFSIVEILVTLYYDILSLDRGKAQAGDRFILSKGHGCLALYAILADLGYFPKEELQRFCSMGGILAGHPTSSIPGVEVSTGSLGHGPSIGVGMALALRRKKPLGKVYVLVGDGECNEGSVWEAALSASQKNLDNFIILIDKNEFQSYGRTEEVCSIDPLNEKWKAFGFDVEEVDLKREPERLSLVLNKERKSPLAVICHTVKGMGNRLTEGNLSWHHKNRMTDEEIKALRQGFLA